MNHLDLTIADNQEIFAPGDTVEGTASWRFDPAGAPADDLVVRLFWYTQGRGDRDVEIVASELVHSGSAQGSGSFRFTVPSGPLSFSGSLISLRWAIELVRLPDAATVRREIVVATGAGPIVLSKTETEK